MASKYDGDIAIATAGFGEPMKVRPGVVCCGSIWNGIGISFGNSAGGVIAFADLERVYLAAKAHRETAFGKKQLAQAERDYGT